MVYALFSEYTKFYPKWGVLTGVRPSKLLINTEKKMGREKTEKYFLSDLLVTKEETTREFNLFFTNGKKYIWVYYHTQLKWYTYDYDCVDVLHMEIMKLVFDLMLSKIRRSTNGKTKEKL